MANEVELGTGLLSYGSFIFPNAIKATIAALPFEDSTNRFTKYVVYRLKVETVLYPGVHEAYYQTGQPGEEKRPIPFEAVHTSADFGMDLVRKTLTERGHVLHFTGKGFGSFSINTAQQDILNGPNPRVIVWEPIGDNYAVRIVWEVEVVIAECAVTLPSVLGGRITEFNFDISWAIDLAGMTTRTISGHAEIVLNIVGGHVLANADHEIRDALRFSIPIGFGRVAQNYRLNARRDRLDFQIVDREYEHDDKNPLHPGLVRMDVQQTTATSGINILTPVWQTTIHGRITVAKGQPKFLAWVAFLHVIQSRLDIAREKANRPIPSGTSPGEEEDRPDPLIIPGRLSITEDIYGRGMSFSFGWIMHSTLRKFLDASGIWQPIPGTTPTRQAASLLVPGGAWTPRGFKQLRHNRTEPLVSLCSDATISDVVSNAARRTTTDETEMFKTECPPPESSYLSFSPHVYEIEDTRRSASFSAIGAVRGDTPSFSEGIIRNNRVRITSSASAAGEVTTIPKIHQSGSHYSRVIFFGSAARLGYPIPQIHLKSYGGAEVAATGKQIQTVFPPVDVAGCPLYRVTWQREYHLLEQPTGQNVITSPAAESINLVPLTVPVP